MLCCRIILLVAVLFSLSCISIQAQSPRSAIDRYEDGTRKFKKGDLDGAIEDFTRAIRISSRLEGSRPAPRLNRANGFADSSDEAGEITVIDPLTAKAYTSRGLARYGKGDIDGAIADWDMAIRIHPGLAETYVNRGAARYVKGDSEGALADWDRAIQI